MRKKGKKPKLPDLPRNWAAVAACFRRSAVMKHRTEARGGARNRTRDLMRECDE